MTTCASRAWIVCTSFHFQYFCYVSTAYCHLEQKVLEEKAYPPLRNPHDVIKTVEELDDNMIEIMTPKYVELLTI